jgi:hypothetical protein
MCLPGPQLFNLQQLLQPLKPSLWQILHAAVSAALVGQLFTSSG